MKTNGDSYADIVAFDGGEDARNADAFLLEEFLPYELSVAAGRTSRLFARRFEAAFGLSIAEWRVLAVVGRFGTITPSAVAERTDMDKVKVSRATASLVATNLLEQGPAPHDGRARLLRLTRKGRTVHDSIVPLALGAGGAARRRVDRRGMDDAARLPAAAAGARAFAGEHGARACHPPAAEWRRARGRGLKKEGRPGRDPWPSFTE